MAEVETKVSSLFINGEWQDSDSGKTEAVVNPANLETIIEVAYGGKQETERAIEAAKAAFVEWSEMSPRKRSRILYKAHQLIYDHLDRLAEILTMEQGKPFKEARGEVKSAANFLLWYAEEANRIYGEWMPSSQTQKRILVVPQPVGVVGAITPWNFPSSMITRKIGPALAAGCTVVLKPAPETPLSAIELVKLFEQAGLPKGVLNLVTGDAEEIGQALLQNKDVRLITFTGSTEVGKYLMRESAQHVKKLSLELGGHAPVIVFEDADLDVAAKLTLASKYRNAGQTCICANRVYVHESVQEKFSQKLLEHIQSLKVGEGLDPNTDIGPLINEQAVSKVESHLNDAVKQGAEVVYGGAKWEGELNGYFFSPTIVKNVTKAMAVMNEETFGPLLPLQTFQDEAEVIAEANDTDYGLAAYIFSENLDRSLRVMEKLEYGIVGVNDVFPATAEAPFGGVKQSGVGKEGGHHGIHEFVEQKYVSIGMHS
ncbi:NAD-dependent succinate-semialdehyde dehydrogenase [Piscibacillus halophilus]|uniref:Aldehyde dehydrogenase n=1 Tax=Piscibacillus halophilus TaxID=571933 RepID=A0A1H9ECF1_9BACI|nr:NAD-dependent succinate-semialdehyde dehydrogenase [Piscibacillus halophilus]SEQ23380.1 succinate-semialdehyde dehydrogenase / glutarate-semialdehyde dehydrogenase [Piscibacillus halophilus]